MDINCSRYFDSIGVSGYNKNTFLNHWNRKWKDWFFEHYRKEADISHALTSAYYKKRNRKGKTRNGCCSRRCVQENRRK